MIVIMAASLVIMWAMPLWVKPGTDCQECREIVAAWGLFVPGVILLGYLLLGGAK